VNLFSYVDNNPVDSSDYFGLEAASWGWNGGESGILIPNDPPQGGTKVLLWEAFGRVVRCRNDPSKAAQFSFRSFSGH